MASKYRIKRILAAIVFGSLFIGLVGYVIMLLWNALIPEIFSVSEITFLQALGLLVLARILFGGFGGRGFRGRSGWRRKWMHMTPEEREQFRKKWKEYSHKKVDDK